MPDWLTDHFSVLTFRHSVLTGMADRLWVGILSRYVDQPPRPTQPPTLPWTGNEYPPSGQSAVMCCAAAGE